MKLIKRLFSKPVQETHNGTKRANMLVHPIQINLHKNPKPAEITPRLPRALPSGERIARKMLKNPYRGNTGFTVRGQTVYHASAGSSKKSKTGTFFWIVEEPYLYLIAIGEHTGTNNKTYRILWKAAEVPSTDTVVLESAIKKIGP